ncbi:hypothetical protein EYM_05780 [Ignicoccus islandicus DSM 13165]|uniref:Uncharacterized protein n=1 Tax=Ignicoccus islandicus DSM 13165 TaxID=940295 RepID=A0A0U3G2X8_9CREN|nr:hypothetical protein [Ignicoccus islandicus]ALU12620.1 hypothetical protein EYM_05780 [Ignicoccus islandicus DSM 13165]
MKRKRAQSLMQLMDIGLNTPIFVVVTQSNLRGLEHFKKQCAIRFDELACELPEVDALVVPGPPPLIAHSSPCIAKELLRELAERGCPFEAQVTDVTIKDSVGAGASIKFDGKVMAEVAIGGSVRDVTRRGKIDARAYLEGNAMKVIGSLGGLLAYCTFESLLALRRMPDGVLEWSCHEGKYGVRGDHVIFWEYHPL